MYVVLSFGLLLSTAWANRANERNRNAITINLRPDENDTLTNLESNFFPSVIDNEGNKPRFTAPAKNRRRNIQRPVGSSARLRCKATGKPKPEIIWYKDNKQIVEERNSNDHVHTQKWTLHLSDLRNEDSGKYTCRVYNRAGMINYTYTVEVIEKIKMKPELIPPHPVNMTVKYGGMAQFQCRVRSDSEPTIKWLKQVSTKSTTQLNNTIKVDNQLFAVLKTGDVWSRKDGTFLNKLVITNARMADAGMYICLGANTLGYSFRQAFLTVNISDSQLLKEKNARSSSSHSGFNPTTLTLVIAIPSACVIFFVITTVYILHRKHTCMASSSQKLTVTVTRTPKHNISANHLDKDQFRPLKSQSPHGYSQKRSETPYSESPYSEQYDGVPYSVSEVQYGSDRQYRDYPEVAHPSHAGVYLAPGSISDYPDLQSNPGDYRHTNSIASDYREINSGRSDLSSLPRLGNNHHNNYLNA
ncbi:unnamed protein product [Owenia fusiformis]|uniref:receptor protein-tyrosine kinase n=1 Tax=Owenia fusiformis TaxID=6347 RepID=A0A8S4NNV1_OWEFU|nr:unnamed protein product [Owenia fusiformis]